MTRSDSMTDPLDESYLSYKVEAEEGEGGEEACGCDGKLYDAQLYDPDDEFYYENDGLTDNNNDDDDRKQLIV
jgi:hypothetical protein